MTLRDAWRDWRATRHMTIEQKLEYRFEKYGTRGFIVVPTAEVMNLFPKRRTPEER